MSNKRGNIGRLYIADGGVPDTLYVLLRTGLGWVALDMVTGHTFGGLQRTAAEATNGLAPTGYRLDVDRTCVNGRPYQEEGGR